MYGSGLHGRCAFSGRSICSGCDGFSAGSICSVCSRLSGRCAFFRSLCKRQKLRRAVHGLAAGRCTDVIHGLAALKACGFRHQHGALILHGPESLPITGQRRDAVCARQLIAQCVVMAFGGCDALFLHAGEDLFDVRRAAAIVKSDGYRPDLEKRLEECTRILFRALLVPEADDPFRHRILAG